MSYERRCQVKKHPRGRTPHIFWTSSPDFLSVRARTVSLFLRVVFSRKLAARPCEAASLSSTPVVSFQYRDGANRFSKTDKHPCCSITEVATHGPI